MNTRAPLLTRQALNRALLARQLLLPGKRPGILQAVSRLIGVQAQQPRPPFAALFSRGAAGEAGAIASLIGSRKLVRATAMRTTLHLMTAADYLAFRGCLQPALSAAAKSIVEGRTVGLDLPPLLDAARASFAAGPRTFGQLRDDLARAFPHDERAMGYAVRTHLPLIAVPDESRWRWPADPPFALASSWLGAPIDLADQTPELVMRYLGAFGPATPADFQAWSGLRATAKVFDALRPKLRTFRDERNRELFDVLKAPLPDPGDPVPVIFLADFDNAILGHADRSRIIADEHRPRVVTKNLLVLATFLVDGFVAGTWRVARDRREATLEIHPFGQLRSVVAAQLRLEGERLLRFLEPDTPVYNVSRL